MSCWSDHPVLCGILADAVLLLHFAFVAFVVVGLAAIWLGYFLRWGWVRQFHFRLAHSCAMGFVAYEAVTQRDCPLTLWEDQLRLLAGDGQRYEGSFIQHWLHLVLFYEGNETTFLVLDVAVFVLICLSLWLVPPRWPRRRERG